jgi:hypothetical protein
MQMVGIFLASFFTFERWMGSAAPSVNVPRFTPTSEAGGSDGADGSGGKPEAGLPPLPQALEIPSGLPHSRGSTAAYR